MKKILNLTLLLLFFALSSSFGCRSWFDRKDQDLTEQSAIDQMNWDELFENAQNSVSDRPVEEVPLPSEQQQVPVEPMPGLVAVGGVDASTVSRTFPWPECGLVQLDKIMPKEIGLNKPFNYTLKLTNLTDKTLNDIVIEENTAAHFNFISSTPAARQEENKVVWEINVLEPKTVRLITVTGMANSVEPLRQCTTVLTPVIPACTTVDVIEPRLSLVRDIPSESMLCDLIPVRYIVSNTGTGTVPNVRIMETLPPGLRTSEGKGDLIFEVGNIGPGQSREFSAELRPSKTGQYLGRAVASSTMGVRAESDETVTVVGLPILSINKIGPEKLYIGRPVSYEIIVANVSDVPAKDTVVEDSIPQGMTSVKATSGAKFTDSKLVWNIGTIAPNSSETLRISYTPTKPGTLINDATASAYCAEPVTASVKTIVTGIPAVMLEVIDLEDPVRIGNRATYMITVTNQGSATATNIRVACVLENNVQYVSSTGATTSSVVGDTVRFLPLSALEPKDKAVWRIVVSAVRPGDVRFKVAMNCDELSRPVEETEATHLYE